jgi:uncharacterized membrane protein YgaE (UPF0421/DUF939 family)
VAAALAWLVVLPLGGLADTYPYYAPLGAVVGVSGTVVGSVRGAVQGVAAIACGAALSLTVLNLHLPVVLGLGVVVAAGSLLGGWRRLGEHGSWVAWSAVFVLIGANGDPASYALAYGSLVSLGAAVGILVTLVMPPLPLSASAGALDRLGRTLAGQLDDLVDGLRSDETLDDREWAHRCHAMEPATAEMRRMVRWATEARRANWRQRHWARRADAQYRLAVSLNELSFLVEHLTGLLSREESSDAEEVALGPHLRPTTADVLAAVARFLRSERDAHAQEEAQWSLDVLADHVRARRDACGDDLFTAGAVVTVVRRALVSLAPTTRTSP